MQRNNSSPHQSANTSSNGINFLGQQQQQQQQQALQLLQSQQQHQQNILNTMQQLNPAQVQSQVQPQQQTTAQQQTLQSSQKDTTFTKIFVGGLPYHTTDQSLKQFFQKFGNIEEAVVITDRTTGKSRGYGFVSQIKSHIKK